MADNRQISVEPLPDKKLSFWLVFWDLFVIQLANWRWAWPATLINGLLVPLLTFFFFVTAGISNTPEANAYLLSGNIVASLIFTTMYGTSARFAFMRTFGVLDYYATLPVYKPLLVLAVNAGFLVLTLPSALLTVLMGIIFFNINLSINPIFVLLVPLASFSLSAVGAFVGVSAPNFDTANTITGILQFIFLGAGPILIPAERLPDAVNIFSRLLPSTYAAGALRHSLSGNYDTVFWIDVAVLIVFDLAAMVFVARRMEWRAG